jgi:prepilin-type processing-associated H-X9-DG protein/prepilin-type N-terminal cleavage/methylation domain-containing protein
MTMPCQSTRRAFTLIEMLVVISIIMVLASLVLVVGVRARLSARAAYCANSMRQIGLALSQESDRGVSHHWADSIQSDYPHKPLLLCPQGPQDGQTNYGVNQNLLGKPSYSSDTGNTVLLYESKRAGENLSGDWRDVDMRHSGWANFVFLDGHAKKLREIPPFGP